MSRARQAPHARSVFINCSYHTDCLPLLQAMVFTLHACGFVARPAMLGSGLDRVCRPDAHDSLRVPDPQQRRLRSSAVGAGLARSISRRK